MIWLPHLNLSPEVFVSGSSASVDSSVCWTFWVMVCRCVKLHCMKHNFKINPLLSLLRNILSVSALFFFFSFQDFWNSVFQHSLQIYWMKKKTPVKYNFSWHKPLPLTGVHHSWDPAHNCSLQHVFVVQFETQSKFKGIYCVISGLSKIHRYVLHLWVCVINPLRQDGKN